MDFLNIPLPAVLAQLVVGLINGAFYALLSLGLAIIFGLLNIINFAHGAQYMLGAFFAWFGVQYLGIDYWFALLLVPIAVGAIGMLLERFLLSKLYREDHLYGLLLTFGLALIIEGVFVQLYGVSGKPYAVPEALREALNLGFMFLPKYRAWVIVASVVVCLGAGKAIPSVRFVAERTTRRHAGALVRSNPRESDVPSGQISVPTGARAGLAAIDAARAALARARG